MASQKQNYSNFGPPPILSFDWKNLYHKTSSASCLVEAAYRLERERQKKKRVGINSLAKDWWEKPGFILEKILIDKNDESIYGAVFRKGYNRQNTSNSALAPKYVIALRGTIMKCKTVYRDVKTNIRFPTESINGADRYAQLIQEVQHYVYTHGNTNVWITGHSLGAGLALKAGKTMAMKGFPMEAYIFNPPSSLFPLDQLVKNHEKLKFKVRFARDIVKACVTIALLHEKVPEDPISLTNLASWRPHLFVNQSDPICSEIIGHFRYKDKMAKKGFELIERLAAKISFRSLVFGGGELSSSYSSPQHLHFLPSAYMIENTIKPTSTCLLKGLFTNHGIQQWWSPELERHSTTHLYESYS